MRFHGAVGYGEPVEIRAGVRDERITEQPYFGDVVRNSRQLREGEKVNNDLSVGNSISIVADEYANKHFFSIRYVVWEGVRWIVTDVEVQPPRLLLRLGGVYNGPGPTATPPDTP